MGCSSTFIHLGSLMSRFALSFSHLVCVRLTWHSTNERVKLKKHDLRCIMWYQECHMMLSKILFHYLTVSPVPKMSARSFSATPFPTNVLLPEKLNAPRVHFPSTSENTDTASPAFMSEIQILGKTFLEMFFFFLRRRKS